MKRRNDTGETPSYDPDQVEAARRYARVLGRLNSSKDVVHRYRPPRLLVAAFWVGVGGYLFSFLVSRAGWMRIFPTVNPLLASGLAFFSAALALLSAWIGGYYGGYGKENPDRPAKGFLVLGLASVAVLTVGFTGWVFTCLGALTSEHSAQEVRLTHLHEQREEVKQQLDLANADIARISPDVVTARAKLVETAVAPLQAQYTSLSNQIMQIEQARVKVNGQPSEAGALDSTLAWISVRTGIGVTALIWVISLLVAVVLDPFIWHWTYTARLALFRDSEEQFVTTGMMDGSLRDAELVNAAQGTAYLQNARGNQKGEDPKPRQKRGRQ